MRRISPADWHEQAWKNGRGITCEVLRDPPTGDYDVRVSVARVEQSGPFSTFPGYRRFTFLLGPAPITLEGTTRIELVAVGDHVALPGEVAIEATLRAGPTRLCNILVRTELIANGARAVGFGKTPTPVRFVFEVGSQVATFDDVATPRDTTACVWIA